jgi:hypothetical protein
MKKIIFCLFISIILLVKISYSQTIENKEGDEIELKFNPTGDTLSVNILNKDMKEFDIFIYKSYDEIKLNLKGTKENPMLIPISEWDRGMYHFKIDYNYITQFRNIEIF